MYAYELYENALQIVSDSCSKIGRIQTLENLFANTFNALIEDEYFSRHEATEFIIGAFACVACNDGKISRDEYAAFKNAVGEQDFTYDDFFNLMSQYNRKTNRDNTVNVFNGLKNRDTVLMVISLCIATALQDGYVHENEELFCTSLCEVYLNRFER